MFVLYTVLIFLGVLGAFRLRRYVRKCRAARAMVAATSAGVSVDADGNIDAERTYAAMVSNEVTTGKAFTGKKARFMELMRIVSEGPRNADEIRFLFEEGISSILRPDGKVYVPCIENEHMQMEGEIELTEEDLDTYLARLEASLWREENGDSGDRDTDDSNS